MSEWKKVRLGDILLIQKKSKIKASDGIENGIYPFFTCSNDIVRTYNSAQYKGPALIFGTGGKASVHFCDTEFSTSTDCLTYYPVSSEINLDLVNKYIQSNIYLLENGFKGAGLKHVSRDYIANIEINLPDIKTQNCIVQKLNKAKNIISNSKKLLTKYDLLIKSRFIEMFGDKPVESGKWKVETLGSHLITIDNGKSFVCSDSIRKGEYPAILKLSAVTYGEYNQNENKALLDEDMFLKKVEVKQGDLLFTRKNTPELVGMAAYVFETERNLMMPDLIFRLNVKDDLNKIYLWKLINHPLFRERIQNLANGSAKSMSNISKERLQTLKIPVPPLALQNEFSSFVQQIDKSKFAVQKALEKAETLYKSLMQLYFA